MRCGGRDDKWESCDGGSFEFLSLCVVGQPGSGSLLQVWHVWMRQIKVRWWLIGGVSISHITLISVEIEGVALM